MEYEHNGNPPAESKPKKRASSRSKTGKKNAAMHDLSSGLSSMARASAGTAGTLARATPSSVAKPVKQAEKDQEDVTPKVVRFVTKKVCALSISADGTVKQEMVPGL